MRQKLLRPNQDFPPSFGWARCVRGAGGNGDKGKCMILLKTVVSVLLRNSNSSMEHPLRPRREPAFGSQATGAAYVSNLFILTAR